MNIPPYLERLLLSNEATFKNASLGLNGQNMVYVPIGKTAVILEVSIEPFVNDITEVADKIFAEGVDKTTSYKSQYISFLNRLMFQLQIINDNYSTYFSFHDCFSLNTLHTGGDPDITGTINLNFTGKRENVFIYTDRSIYFNILYAYQSNDTDPATTGLHVYYDKPINNFIPKIQILPKTAITFYKNLLVDNVDKIVVYSPAADSYYPLNHQSQNLEDPQMEYLHLFVTEKETTIMQPVDDATTYNFKDLFKLPLINVKYVLINKRASDYGIVAPK